MSEKEAVEILIRNGASVFDNKTINEDEVDIDPYDADERDNYQVAKKYLINDCGYILK